MGLMAKGAAMNERKARVRRRFAERPVRRVIPVRDGRAILAVISNSPSTRALPRVVPPHANHRPLILLERLAHKR